MEYQEGGTLGDFIDKQPILSEDVVKVIMAQLFLTLDYMARRCVVHKDLKPENILLNSKAPGSFDIRIADFGFSTVIGNSNIVKVDPSDEMLVCGTPGFIAPESLRGKGYSLKTDMFSAGAIFYNILTKKSLFYDDDHSLVIRKNYECDIEQTLYTDLAHNTKDVGELCRLLLSSETSKRPFAVQALRH